MPATQSTVNQSAKKTYRDPSAEIPWPRKLHLHNKRGIDFVVTYLPDGEKLIIRPYHPNRLHEVNVAGSNRFEIKLRGRDEVLNPKRIRIRRGLGEWLNITHRSTGDRLIVTSDKHDFYFFAPPQFQIRRAPFTDNPQIEIEIELEATSPVSVPRPALPRSAGGEPFPLPNHSGGQR